MEAPVRMGKIRYFIDPDAGKPTSRRVRIEPFPIGVDRSLPVRHISPAPWGSTVESTRTLLAILVCCAMAAIGCHAVNNDPVLSSWDKPAPKLTASPFASYTDK